MIKHYNSVKLTISNSLVVDAMSTEIATVKPVLSGHPRGML